MIALEIAVLLLVSAFLIVLNGFFVASEFAIISVARPRIQTLASEGHRGAQRVQEVISSAPSQDRYIATAQLGLSLASLGLGMYAEHGLVTIMVPWLEHMPWAAAIGDPHDVAHVAATGMVLAFLTYWHIVIGEMVPKSIALVAPEKTAFALVLPMRILYVVLFPLIMVLNVLGNMVLRILRLPISADMTMVYSQDELRLIFEESHEEGQLEGEEHRLMQRVLSFGKRPVRQVMVGRTRSAGIPIEGTVDQALTRVAEEAYTRYPVFEKDMDHIVGIVHVKDLMRSKLRHPGDRPIRDLVRYVPFVPESMWISELFEKMQRERVQMAVVMDEHGGTAGIVTMEDLVEEIFGEVHDEFDAEEEEPIVVLPSRTWRVQGGVTITALSEALDRDLDFEDVETVNGLVVDLLGRPPRPGDVVEDQQIRITVDQVHDLTVAVARVQDLQPREEDEVEVDGT